jgi:hypothetical protein
VAEPEEKHAIAKRKIAFFIIIPTSKLFRMQGTDQEIGNCINHSAKAPQSGDLTEKNTGN